MRHLSSASLAAAIALAFATAATAATTTPPKSNIATPGGFTSLGSGTAPAVTTAVTPVPASSSTTTTTTTTPTAPSNTTTVDVRNQQTLNAVAANHASGSTSSLGPLAGASTVNGITPGTTSGSTVGTTTGTETGTGTTTGTGATVGATGLGVPVFNTFTPSDVTATGAVATTTTAPLLASNGVFSSSDVYGTPVLSANVVAPSQAANDAAVNRALNQVARDRKRVGRNGQLLYSIAPRTNVDRSNEIPDDGPSPSLSGYYSTLTR